MKSLLKSRKFWLAIIAVIVSLLEVIGLKIDEQAIQQIVLAIVALIGGIAIEDAGAKSANNYKQEK